MATITRTQTFVRTVADLTAVHGNGTVKFQKSGAPDLGRVKSIGAVFNGNLRVTRLASGEGYNFLLTDVKRGTDRRRVFFRGDALVRVGNETMTVETYFQFLLAVENLRKRLGL